MNIEVNWDSTSDLSRVITQLQKRRKKLLEDNGSKPLTFAASRYNAEHIIPFLEKMYDAPCDYIESENSNANFYVYVHCDPRKPLNAKANIKHLFLASRFGLKYEPFYVGKGTGNRAYDLTRNDSHRKVRSLIRKQNKDIVVSVIDRQLSEAAALHKESALMDILGLRSVLQSGLLVNLDEGLSEARYGAYSQLENDWEGIQKILRLNRCIFKKSYYENHATKQHTTREVVNSNTMVENLQMLQTLYNKYPSASHDFILSKAKLS